MADDVLRVANCSGFYGDRINAAKEMVEGGPIDVLTGDYLAAGARWWRACSPTAASFSWSADWGRRAGT